MVKEKETGFLRGQLLAGKTAEDDDQYQGENASELRQGVVFTNDDIDLLFRSSMGRYTPLEDDDFLQESNRLVYYPYYNETVCEVGNPNVDNRSLDLVYDDISIRYTRIGDNVYIHSQAEVTAYSHNHIVVNDDLYVVLDSLFHGNHPNVNKDEFLGLDHVNNGVCVKNIQTGQVRAVREQKVRDLVESDEYNGALKVSNPDLERYNPATQLARELRQI